MKRVRAVREQGRKAFTQIQAAAVELDQQRDEMRGCAAFGLRGQLEMCQQVLVRQPGESGARDSVDAPSIPSSFSSVRLFL